MQIIAAKSIKKGGSWAAFFCAPLLCLFAYAGAHAADQVSAELRAEKLHLVQSLITKAKQKNLAEEPRWMALLHANEDGFQIKSAGFLLSSRNPSLQNELEASLHFLYAGENNLVCRFPARYLWLREQLDAPELDLASCNDFQEFVQRAPAEQISLVFASENIGQPSSMMGHVFLKLDGIDKTGQYREHAISFFTDAAGFNAPKLFFDSMVIGKRGFFALSPYQEKLELYLGEEQRNVWEYRLRLQPSQKYLLQAHLIELKQTELTYFFQKYNCATVVDFILAVGSGKFSRNAGFWLTPKDVVKRAQQYEIIDESVVRPPNRWLVRAFADNLSATEVGHIKDAVEHLSLPELNLNDELKQAQMRSLALAYLSYRTEQKVVDPEKAAAYRSSLQAYAPATKTDVSFSVEERRNPYNMPQDSQWDIGLVRRQNQNFARYTLTPASHHLEDDNRSYANESELVLFELSLLQNLQRRQLLLDQLTIYSAKSLIPFDVMTGGVSGSVLVNMGPQYGKNAESKQTWQAGAGVGYSQRWMSDIDVSLQINGGISNRLGQFQLFLQPQMLFVVRSLFDMKTLVSYSHLSTVAHDQSAVRSLRWQQSKYFKDQSWSIHASLQRDWFAHRVKNQFELRLRHLF